MRSPSAPAQPLLLRCSPLRVLLDVAAFWVTRAPLELAIHPLALREWLATIGADLLEQFYLTLDVLAARVTGTTDELAHTTAALGERLAAIWAILPGGSSTTPATLAILLDIPA